MASPLFVIGAVTLLMGSANPLSYIRAPYGAITVPAGTARIYTRSYDVVIVRSHPRNIRTHVARELQEKIDLLLTKMETRWEGQDLVRLFRTRLTNIQRTLATRRRRWAPLEPIGALVGNVFGLATTEDTKELRLKVNNIIDGMNDQVTAVVDLTMVVNDTVRNQARVKATIDSLMRRARTVHGVLDTLRLNVTRLQTALIRSYAYQVVEGLLSTLETYKLQEEAFERKHLHLRDLAEIGHITEDLVPVRQLRDILRRLNSPLNTTYIYRYFPVRLIKLSDREVGYIVSIPVLDPEVFTAWAVLTVPYLSDGDACLQILPEAQSIAVGHVSGSIIKTSDCLHKDPMLCPSAIRFQSMSCVQGILAKNAELLSSCSVASAHSPLPAILKAAGDQLLLTTDGTTLEERCLGRASRTLGPLRGTFVISLEAGCTVASGEWSYSPDVSPPSAADTRVIREEFLIDLVDVNLTEPTAQTLPPLNWDHLEELQNFTYRKLPTLARMTRQRHITTHDAHVAWIGASMAILIAIIVVGTLLRRHYRSFCRRRSRRAPPPVPADYKDEDDVDDDDDDDKDDDDDDDDAQHGTSTQTKPQTKEDKVAPASPFYPRLMSDQRQELS